MAKRKSGERRGRGEIIPLEGRDIGDDSRNNYPAVREKVNVIIKLSDQREGSRNLKRQYENYRLRDLHVLDGLFERSEIKET